MFETAGERGRILNRISGLDEIDQTQDMAREDVTKLKAELKNKKKDIDDVTEHLKSFELLEEMDLALAEVEKKVQDKENKESRLSALVELKGKYEAIEIELTKRISFLECSTKIDELKEVLDVLIQSKRRIEKLKAIQATHQRILQSETKETFDGFYDKLNIINDLKKNLDRHKLKHQQLRFMKRDMLEIDSEIQEKEKELSELKKKLPNVCTKCGRPI